MPNAITVFNSSFIGSSAGSAVLWPKGAKGSLVITCEQYGSGVYLQFQAGNGNWVSLNSAPIVYDFAYPFSLPAGQYRMISNAGSSIGMTAILTSN